MWVGVVVRCFVRTHTHARIHTQTHMHTHTHTRTHARTHAHPPTHTHPTHTHTRQRARHKQRKRTNLSRYSIHFYGLLKNVGKIHNVDRHKTIDLRYSIRRLFDDIVQRVVRDVRLVRKPACKTINSRLT